MILYFLILGFALFVLLWRLFGSPTLDSTIMTVGALLVTSEMLLWRKVFSVDKNTALSFIHLEHDIKDLKKDVDNRFKEVNNRFDHMEKLIKNKI